MNQDNGDTAAEVGGMLAAFFGPASPSAVFSEPQKIGDDLVFTASAFERGGGFGFGGGEDADPERGTRSGGQGGGGGGGAQGRPVAVIRVGPGGIDVRPVMDLTKVGLTILGTLVSLIAAFRKR
ncbi:MAG: hypothetical protein WB239_09245 [Acidimicrobiia bacterium]